MIFLCRKRQNFNPILYYLHYSYVYCRTIILYYYNIIIARDFIRNLNANYIMILCFARRKALYFSDKLTLDITVLLYALFRMRFNQVTYYLIITL